MKLGFVSAILPELSLEEVLAFAAAENFSCVEVMCWPVGKAERRYAGVTHLEVGDFSDARAAETNGLLARHGVALSALGYYPNPLCADESEGAVYLDHLKKVISAAQRLGLENVNTFLGRDPARSLEDNWRLFDERWPAIVRHAEQCGVRIGIENCPMFFTGDEWPGGKNLAVSPKIWREMFRRLPSANFGLNYDPSHAVWQFMDAAKHVHDFADRIFHVHAKDARIDQDKLDDCGILATPLEFHQPKLPGLGDVRWSKFFAALTDIGYRGPVCIEVEDRAYEHSLEGRQDALRQSARFLRQYMP
ncbi:MAG: sugar phosphate isomerase/epimerase [Chthoniobacteraceae bacterium]